MVTRLHTFPTYEKEQATALLRVYKYNDIIRYNNKFNNNNFIAPRSQVRNKSELGLFFYTYVKLMCVFFFIHRLSLRELLQNGISLCPNII